MTSLAQLIPSYSTGGISDQPDELKKPGQLVDAENVFPDLTYGMVKRPGFQLVSNLTDECDGAPTSTTGTWFTY